MTLHPWQQREWRRLRDARRADRLPHALLLAGAQGTGKTDFAGALAAAVLCETPGADSACGRCRSCALRTAGTHPDLVLVTPEEAGKTIKVDQVRAAIGAMQMSRHFGHSKVAVIAPADAMNNAAANALLKTLEEPPAGALFILVTSLPERLPATIRSRCSRIAMTGDPGAQAWVRDRLGDRDSAAAVAFALADGAPLRALALAGDGSVELHAGLAATLESLARRRSGAMVAAAAWDAAGAERILPLIASIARDGIVLRLSGAATSRWTTATSVHLQGLVNAVDLPNLFNLHARALEYARLLHGSPGLRERALLDELAAFVRDSAGMTSSTERP